MSTWWGVSEFGLGKTARLKAALAALLIRRSAQAAALAFLSLAGITLAPSEAAALAAVTSTTVSASPSPAPYGTPVTFTATVTSGAGTPDGTVLFLADTVSLGSATLDGTGHASFTASTLPVGVHSIIAIYLGNLNFLTSTSAGVNLSISSVPCTLAVTASVNPLIFGTSENLTATVTPISGSAIPTGNVTLRSGSTVLGTVALGGSGQGVLSTSTLPVGLLSISADYSGDGNFLGCTAPIIIITINKSPSTSAVSSSLNPSAVGANVTFTATITGAGGTPTGTVTFKDGASVIGTGTLDGSGRAALTTASLGTGSHSISVTYVGDDNFVGSSSPALTQLINQAASTTTLTSSGSPAAAGTPVTFTANVTGTGVVPTGTVSFRDGATTIGTGALNGAGQATFITNGLALGNHTITAVYGGDANYVGSASSTLAQATVAATSTTSLAVTPNPASAGAAVTFNAMVVGTGGIPTGSVTFKDGATVIGTATLDGTGHASLINGSLGAGVHLVTAAYSGDGNYAASISVAISLQINAGVGLASTTSLTATPNPSTPGAPVTFAATVTAPVGTPTGSVTFKDGATVIGTATLNGSGRAALVTSSLANGSHSITAIYSGDIIFAASTSAALPFAVTPAGAATTTTLSSSANPGVSGQALTFTASVAGSGGTPTGTVTFSDGGNLLGRASLAGTTASLTLSSLGVGSHSITASYGGDANFAASTSSPLAQSISVPADSVKLRDLQVVATRIAAQNSGEAISGAIDAAIDEGFSDGNRLAAPSELGLRLSSAGYDQQVNGQTKSAPRIAPNWMIWSDLRHTSWSSNGSQQDITGNHVNALAGVTYKLAPDLLVGVFGGYEAFNYDVASLDGRLRGDGWTGGGYVGWRILPGVRFDAGAAQSAMEYQGSAGTAAASFPGSRTLVTTALTGNYKVTPNFELEPSARVFALWEKEDGYSDSLGTAQSDRHFSAGRASVGTKLIYHWDLSGSTAIAPFAGIYADNYFNKDDASVASLPVAMLGPSARVVGGVAVTTDYGLKFSSSAELGGIGGNFTSWTLRARGAVPF